MDFEDIRPYTNLEFKEAYYRLMDDKRFQDAIKLCLKDYTVDDFRRDIEKYDTVEAVQADFDKRFIDAFLAQSSKGVSFFGLENIKEDKSYLYIGNHRDITFDPALLQYYFFCEKRKTSRIAMGDNLFTTPLLVEVAKVNKMIKVKRSGTMREKLENSRTLAAYIQHSLFKENESVWIAQRDGRTKDGFDFTKQGLLKMITLGVEKPLLQMIREMSITPVTMSYEYEPCDSLKARELAISEHQTYQKQPGEDFNSIKQGIFGQKGRITLVIGTPLDEELNEIPEDLSDNDKLHCVCQFIDNQIYKNYTLYPNNYIAHDILHNDDSYKSFYSEAEKSKFESYLDLKSQVADVEKQKMRENLLKIYATPVDNKAKVEKNNIL